MQLDTFTVAVKVTWNNERLKVRTYKEMGCIYYIFTTLSCYDCNAACYDLVVSDYDSILIRDSDSHNPGNIC